MSVTATDSDSLVSDALVVTQVVDAASGQPRPVLGATTQTPHAFAGVATGSYLVLSGRPDLVFPALATTSYQIASQLDFPDRRPLTVDFTVPAGTVLPYRPAEIEVELPSVTVQGTVTQAAYPNGPIAAAKIMVGAAAPPPQLLSLRTPVAVEHPPGATVTGATVSPAAGATTLVTAAAQGDEQVTLLSTSGCVSGGALLLGGDPDAEHALISTVETATDQVTLGAPLQRSRVAGSAAQALTVSTPGPASALARDAEPSDGILELAGPLAAELIQIAGPTTELRAVGAVSDPNGRWRIDGVRALGQLELTVAASGYTTAGPTAYDVDYSGGPNLIYTPLV